MQFINEKFFFEGVSADTVKNGLEAGEVWVGDGLGAMWKTHANWVKEGTILCRFDGDVQSWKIKITEPNSGCDPCDKRSGFEVRMRREPTFDHETYLGTFGTREFFNYPFNNFTTATTAADIAKQFVEDANHVDAYREAPWFTAELDATDVNGETIIITSKHPDITFDLFNLPDYPENTITEIHEGQGTVLSDTEVKRMFPVNIGFTGVVPGADVEKSWQGCKNPCVLTLSGVITHPMNHGGMAGSWGNALPLYATGGAPFCVEIWLDRDDAGYAAFIAALEAALGITFTDVTPTAYNLAITAADFTVTTPAALTFAVAAAGLVTSIDEYPATLEVVRTSDNAAEQWSYDAVNARYHNPATNFVAGDAVTFEWEPEVTSGGNAVTVDTELGVTLT